MAKLKHLFLVLKFKIRLSMLKKYINQSAIYFIEKWTKDYHLLLKVKNERKTKLGDYKKLKNGHQITINNEPNEDLFFMVLTHEIAHMHAFHQYGFRIKPHGKEWKFVFGKLLKESVKAYKEDFQKIILSFAENPRANYYAYTPIVNYFNNSKEINKILLSDLKENAIFSIGNKIFKKGNKRKIRYICTELSTGKKYSIHGLAPIDKVIN